MELRVLKYFLMVAREENITRAASLLHVSQPSISRQLMQLEDELGVKLFNRSNHSIVLTDEGLLLKRRAQEMLALAEKTKTELVGEDEIRGVISIGAGELKSSAFLAEIMTAFHKEYPQVKYDFYSGNADNIKERIERGILDVGLLLEPVEISKYDFIRIPIKEIWGAYVREDSPFAKKDCLMPEDFEGKSVIMSSRAIIRNELSNWFGEYMESIEVVAGGNLPYNMAMLAAQQLGIFVTLDLNCRYEGLKFIPLSPSSELGSVLSWKKAQPHSRTVEKFLEFAKKCIKRISKHTL